jgi:uncharacterized protein (DUF2249 family)
MFIVAMVVYPGTHWHCTIKHVSLVHVKRVGVDFGTLNKQHFANKYQFKELKMTHDCSNSNSADLRYTFDARGVAKRFRHAAIFGALDALNSGETMAFVNDHDPLPLLAQLTHRYGAGIAINYVSREPGNISINFTLK